jgi:pantetheine-phosphate adenylyltransferase
MNKKRALYAGSFDPFTNGHLSIVKKAAELFDEVIVGLAINSDKKRCTATWHMKDAIINQLKELNINNVIVVTIDGLVADFCEKQNVSYLIRGLRDTSDYLYEENIAKINNEINPNLKTIYFRADNDVISSSMVRELWKYGKDVSQYVPKEVLSLLQ